MPSDGEKTLRAAAMAAAAADAAASGGPAVDFATVHESTEGAGEAARRFAGELITAAPAEPRVAAAGVSRVGILVIHGMGNENPYGTLDAFARGLYQHFGGAVDPRYAMQTQWKQRGSDPAHVQKSWTQAQIRFERRPQFPAADHEPDTITVAEYYWSPATKGKIKDVAVLTWLIRTGLEPFRYLSENLQILNAAEGAGGASKAPIRKRFKRGGFIVLRELWRMAFLYPILLGSFLGVAAFVAFVPTIEKTIEAVFKDPRYNAFSVIEVAMLVALRLMILFSLAGYFANFGKWLHYRSPGSGSRERYDWLGLALAASLAAVIFVLPAWLTGAFASPDVDAGVTGAGPYWWRWLLAYVGQLLLLTKPFTLISIPLVELGIAAVLRNFLIDFLGDVAIYTNLNQRSANFKVRAQILEECGHALTSLYNDLKAESDDFNVVIAAHSLGTVIAYDTVTDLFNRASMKAPASGAEASTPGTPEEPLAANVCEQLSGMMTFGSPLNKTYYFFRDESEAQEVIRAQVVDGLHSFRLLAPNSGLPGAPLVPVPLPGAVAAFESNFFWLNIWAVMDIFSGKLFFYNLTPGQQIKRPYPIPVLAHLSYWTDPEVYKQFAERFF